MWFNSEIVLDISKYIMIFGCKMNYGFFIFSNVVVLISVKLKFVISVFIKLGVYRFGMYIFVY